MPYQSIKSWTEEDRPREKLMSKGIESLTNAELLAILMRSGTLNSSAVDLAKQLMLQVNNELTRLCRFSLKELMQVRGIGQAKALSILAALELGRRRKMEEGKTVQQIIGSHDAYLQFAPVLEDLHKEEFWILLLDRKNSPIAKIKLSEGGINGTIVDTRLILKLAIDHLASGIILAHNHPSGNLSASKKDLEITHKIGKAASFMDINLLDHLIVVASGYLSFKDEGLL